MSKDVICRFPPRDVVPGEGFGYLLYCEGCKAEHFIPTENYHIMWGFNGDMEKPTFNPSIKLGDPANADCHFIITGGIIAYCADCKHDLKNRHIPLKPVEEWPPES